ncbi:MAG: trypsin-like peptidase domain-containing protein [Cytophagales bacterium]|nr:trypsin-like peptidase domain-containing protein [Cytophagales bacterium]
MREELDSSVVRIFSSADNTRAIGMGFLISSRHIMTCAHVVADALEISRETLEMPGSDVHFDFPLLEDHTVIHSKPVCWFPINNHTRLGDIEDIAVLELSLSYRLPTGAKPAPLIELRDFQGRKVLMFGFPRVMENGDYVQGKLQGLDASGKILIDHILGHRTVMPGFSGTAVWDKEENAVVGMVVSIKKGIEIPPCYMIPLFTLKQAWSEINGDIPPQELDETILKELSRLINTPQKAKSILRNIGFPKEEIPVFSKPYDFWQDVLEEIENGIIEDGFNKLFSAVVERYPHNKTFSKWRKLWIVRK